MSNIAELFPEAAGDSYLGPATVHDDGPRGVEVELGDGARVQARVALAYGYQPAPGDVVLAIGNADGFYVIGVLATACARMSFAGDVELSAGGKIRLRGEEGVAIEGPALDVNVGKLAVFARSVTERFHSLRQSVAELLSVRAGSTHTVVEGSSYTRARDATLLTKEKVSINGKAIHLG